jgi:thymidylate synthase ThyX
MDIFALTDEDGRLFSPVRQASIFAKYSRSPDSARELIKKTDETSAEKFQKKWIVDFGHNAIAELATIPVAFEGVSIIASKCIEKWQRPGVCEKSTRMQEFTRDSVMIPDGLESELTDRVLPLIDQAFVLYQRLIDELPEALAAKRPDASEFQLKRAVFDVARHLLPAGCRTNLGICAYPRDIAEMIAEMTGSNNSEFRDIGRHLKAATEDIGGPLIRHTEPDEWVHNFRVQPVGGNEGIRQAAAHPEVATSNYVQLVDFHPKEADFWETLRGLYDMTPRDLNRVMHERPEHHAAPAIFRDVSLSYSVHMDYGAFRDLQRHRRMEQYVEPLTPYYGFVTPAELSGTTFWAEYQKLLKQFIGPWPKDPDQRVMAQYLLPLAFRVGWHISLDLQQLYYLAELRTRPAGHISYRRVAYQMVTTAEKHLPALVQWVRAVKPD